MPLVGPQLDGSVVSDEYNNGTKSIVIGSNENRLLIVGYGSYQGAGPSGMTYNGVALTKIVEQVGSFNEVCSLWGLVAPDTGTHDLVVSGLGNWSAFGAYSLYNCVQSLPTNFNKTTGDSGGFSLALTTLYKNSWIISAIECEPIPTMTTTDGVLDWNFEGDVFQHAQGQHVVKAAAGAHTISGSLSYGARWNMANIEVRGIPLPDAQVRADKLSGGTLIRPAAFSPGFAR